MIESILANKKAFFLLAIYVLILGLVRVLLSDGIEIDEAEQSYLSQWFLWGYDIQPPLYTWMTIALIEVLGNHHWVYVLLRMCLFFLSYWGLFLLFSRLSQNKKIGWAAVVFSLFLPQFSTESLRHTHTVLVTMASIWTLVCIERIWKKPDLKYYILLGFTLSIGILSKYNFLIFMSSIGATLLLIPKGRHLLFTWKTPVTFLIVLLFIRPHFIWVWEHVWELSSGVRSDLGSTDAATLPSSWAAKMMGLGVLWINLLSFLSAFLVVFVVSHAHRFKSAFQNTSEWTRFFEYFFLLVMGQFILMVVLFNATIFHERWMQPFFVFFPGYCLLKFYPYSLPLKKWKSFQRLGYLAVLVILTIVVARIAIVPIFLQKTIRLNLPHKEFCKSLQSTVKEKEIDLILTDDVLLGGYLNQTFPEIPVVVQEPKYKLVNSHEHGENKNALLIWTWSWRVSSNYKPPKVPLPLQSLLNTHNKEPAISNIQTFNFEYTPSKKASYRYYLLQDFNYR